MSLMDIPRIRRRRVYLLKPAPQHSDPDGSHVSRPAVEYPGPDRESAASVRSSTPTRAEGAWQYLWQHAQDGCVVKNAVVPRSIHGLKAMQIYEADTAS